VLRDKNVNITAAPEVIGLQALAHVAADPDLGPRFLGLSGLDAAALRAAADDPAVLAAVIDFLAASEPDLVACATALALSPAALVDAGRALAGGAA
jgi:hypothetical protein